MKLAAIYNVWDGEELLPASIQSVIDSVDLIIIVYQTVSNFGEEYDPSHIFPSINAKGKAVFHKFNPTPGAGGTQNERSKRNFGLTIAKGERCTHFIHMDCDEFYTDFEGAKNLFIKSGANGSVVRLDTYFKKPTLRLQFPEKYFVPFIHVLRSDTECTKGKEYPFYCDPTRRINEQNVVELPVYMQHYSWVRKDIMRKVRNSSARANIAESTLIRDYNSDLKEGSYVEAYKEKLIEVPDYFGIQSILDA